MRRSKTSSLAGYSFINSIIFLFHSWKNSRLSKVNKSSRLVALALSQAIIMAAQDGLDIPFSSSHSQQTFKLLELPSELLALLESDDPPT